jgi:hypothetical protein
VFHRRATDNKKAQEQQQRVAGRMGPRKVLALPLPCLALYEVCNTV